MSTETRQREECQAEEIPHTKVSGRDNEEIRHEPSACQSDGCTKVTRSIRSKFKKNEFWKKMPSCSRRRDFFSFYFVHDLFFLFQLSIWLFLNASIIVEQTVVSIPLGHRSTWINIDGKFLICQISALWYMAALRTDRFNQSGKKPNGFLSICLSRRIKRETWLYRIWRQWRRPIPLELSRSHFVIGTTVRHKNWPQDSLNKQVTTTSRGKPKPGYTLRSFFHPQPN